MVDGRDPRAPLRERMAWVISSHWWTTGGCCCRKQNGVEFSEHLADRILEMMKETP